MVKHRGLDRVSKAVLGVWEAMVKHRQWLSIGAWIGYPRPFWGSGKQWLSIGNG